MFGWLLRRCPAVPQRFIIENAHYFLDGGTTILVGKDERGRRRLVRLGQHMFEQRGGVGWLYLDRYQIPRRSETERTVVRLLRASLEELRSRAPQAGEQTPADGMSADGAVVYGSEDIAELAAMSAAERLVRVVSDVLAYVESDQYGRVTGW